MAKRVTSATSATWQRATRIFAPGMAVYPLVVPWSMVRRRAARLAHRYGVPSRARLAAGSGA